VVKTVGSKVICNQWSGFIAGLFVCWLLNNSTISDICATSCKYTKNYSKYNANCENVNKLEEGESVQVQIYICVLR